MSTRIEQLVITGFRGATRPVTIDFDKNKYATLVFGENGTGKSTIVDAIDFVCNGQYGSLTELSSTKPKSHVVALNSKSRDLKVAVTGGGQTWTSILGTGGAQCEGPNGKPAARILHRSQLLRVVNAEPKERYKALQDFIAVPNMQACEDHLREAINTAKSELEEAARAKTQAQDALEKLWKNEGAPGEKAEAWGRAQAATSIDQLKTQWGDAKQVVNRIEAYIVAFGSLDTAEEAAGSTKERLTVAEATMRVAESKIAADSDKLVQVLTDAKAYLEAKPMVTTCPVCEQPIKPDELTKRIAERLSQLNDLVNAKSEADNTRTQLTKDEAVVNSERQKLVSAAVTLAELLRKSTLTEVTALQMNWASYSRLLDPAVQDEDSQKLAEAQSLRQTVEPGQTPITTRRDTLDTQIKQYNAIKGPVETIDEKSQAAIDLDRLHKRLAAIHKIVEKERKGYVSGVLAAVSQTVEDMYLRLHPGEDLGGIRMYLKPNVIGSLEFEADFPGAPKGPPQAYYSESHLDTLGVCVFLALAQYFSDGNTIVVLDDVITSVDESHMDRFIQLLHDESEKFNQVIITTHYRPWRDRYKFARGPTSNVQLIELLHWSLPRGVRHSRTKLSVEELQDHVNAEPMDRQIVASKAGVLLESLLDHLALLFRCKLPRQANPNYTLGDLADCIGKKLRPALKVERLDGNGTVLSDSAFGPLIAEIGGTTWIRNEVGCHWNPSGMNVGNAEVKHLAERTIGLAECLVCEGCGELPRRDAGSYWECRCRRLRLHPLASLD